MVGVRRPRIRTSHWRADFQGAFGVYQTPDLLTRAYQLRHRRPTVALSRKPPAKLPAAHCRMRIRFSAAINRALPPETGWWGLPRMASIPSCL